MATPRYLSRGDYEDRVARREQAAADREAAIREMPRVIRRMSSAYGWDNLYAIHPDGQNEPQLPSPWIWEPNIKVWWCIIESERAAELEKQARELFDLPIE